MEQQQYQNEEDAETYTRLCRSVNLKGEMDRFKVDYKQNFNRLRELKSEIERIQKQLERQRVRMQSDFESWHSGWLGTSKTVKMVLQKW